MDVEVTVSQSGRLSIPADVRKRLGLEKGGKLTLEEGEHGLTLSTIEQRVRKAQGLYARYSSGRPATIVDQLLSRKQADAAAERY